MKYHIESWGMQAATIDSTLSFVFLHRSLMIHQ